MEYIKLWHNNLRIYKPNNTKPNHGKELLNWRNSKRLQRQVGTVLRNNISIETVYNYIHELERKISRMCYLENEIGEIRKYKFYRMSVFIQHNMRK